MEPAYVSNQTTLELYYPLEALSYVLNPSISMPFPAGCSMLPVAKPPREWCDGSLLRGEPHSDWSK